MIRDEQTKDAKKIRSERLPFRCENLYTPE